jgi:hypothetical protein
VSTVKALFSLDVVRLKVKDLLSSKHLNPRERTHAKYQQIAASLETVGLIEPLVVFPTDSGYRVLDGHKRLDILRSRKVEDVECLIGTADDSYTYNRRVNYLATIGEHQMILRALQHNSEATIAKALNVNVSTIRKKRRLLDGICQEAVDVLKDRHVSPQAFPTLRKMKPVRQFAAAQLMVASNTYTEKFAQALLAGTSNQMLAVPEERNHGARVLSANQRARLIAETDSVLENVKAVEASYGQEILTLSVCCRYLQGILNNRKLSEYLKEHHPDVVGELRALVASSFQESASTAKA